MPPQGPRTCPSVHIQWSDPSHTVFILVRGNLLRGCEFALRSPEQLHPKELRVFRRQAGELNLEWVMCGQNRRPSLASAFLGLHSIRGVQRGVGTCVEGLKRLLLACVDSGKYKLACELQEVESPAWGWVMTVHLTTLE